MFTYEDVEKYLYLAGIQTYVILWKAVDKAAVRFNGRNVILAAADIPWLDY
jgi:hypothetical protein